MMPRFYPPGSLNEHCLVMHGFEAGKTINDQAHLADHAASDRAVDWLAGSQFQWGRLSAVVPIRHAYAQIADRQEVA